MRLTIVLLMIAILGVKAQNPEKKEQDSVYIDEIEKQAPVKILHAEPLYIDLIRDLGARKGEKEWNVGFGITDRSVYDEYEALVEYEWAPLDRLGAGPRRS